MCAYILLLQCVWPAPTESHVFFALARPRRPPSGGELILCACDDENENSISKIDLTGAFWLVVAVTTISPLLLLQKDIENFYADNRRKASFGEVQEIADSKGGPDPMMQRYPWGYISLF